MTPRTELIGELRRLASKPLPGGAKAERWGVPMRALFDTAKAHSAMALDEVDKLLDEPAYEPRLAAVSILDFKAREARTDEQRRDLCELYLRRHDRIDDWGMVDRAAPWVVGGHLAGRDPAPLFALAKSSAVHERRTAMTAPLYFVKRGSDTDVATGYAIAELLATDPVDIVHNAVGIFIKHAGRRDPTAQQRFLTRFAATMPRPGLRLAVAALPADQRSQYMKSGRMAQNKE